MASWSRRELIGRLALIGGLLALLVVVVRLSLAPVFATSRPDFALMLASGHAQAHASEARTLLERLRWAADRPRIEAHVAAAIARDPTNVVAIASAGLARDLARQPDRAARLFAYSDALSRRDLPTQLWLIESAVAKGDPGTALRHYDVALRTSRSAASLLFPILVDATASPSITEPLARTLATRPPWGPQFVQQLAQSGRDLGAAAALYRAMRALKVEVPEQTVATLTGRMVEARDYQAAWRLYADFHPGARPDTLRNGDLRQQVGFPSPFDWTLSEEPSLGAQLIADKGGGALAFDASVDAGGIAARQLLMLPPGRHALSGRAYDTAQAGVRRPVFRVRCVETIGAETLGQVELPSADVNGAGFQLPFSVPGNCRAQWLELVIVPSEGAVNVSGTVGELSIR
jgi:hypothetical protein